MPVKCMGKNALEFQFIFQDGLPAGFADSLVREIKWYGQNIEGHCFCWGVWLILYLMYEKSIYVELYAHCSFMLIPKYENSPLLPLPFIDNVAFVCNCMASSSTVLKAL